VFAAHILDLPRLFPLRNLRPLIFCVRMLISEPNTDDKPVASLLSRIGGLSTEDSDASPTAAPPQTTQQPPPAPASRPKPNTSNPLFGRALAGVKSDRAATKPKEATPEAKEEPKSQSDRGKELISEKSEGKDKMASSSIIDNDGMPPTRITG